MRTKSKKSEKVEKITPEEEQLEELEEVEDELEEEPEDIEDNLEVPSEKVEEIKEEIPTVVTPYDYNLPPTPSVIKPKEEVIEEPKEDSKFASAYKKLKDMISKKTKKPEIVYTLYLQADGTAKELFLEPKKGMFDINGKTYHVRRDCMYARYIDGQRIPMAIIPEWSLVPIGRKEYLDLSPEQRVAELQDHAIRGIRSQELVRLEGEEKQGLMANKKIIIFAIVGIIAFAFFKDKLGW